MHLLMHAQNYGTLVNTSVAVKEMVHRTFKKIVPHTNLKKVDFDLLRRYNTLQALRYIFDGSQDEHFPDIRVGTGIGNVICDESINSILTGWYITENCQHPTDIEDEGNFVWNTLILDGNKI
jgi:hypothetical protein